jgi:single-stranded-DNA-specific exonuclease
MTWQVAEPDEAAVAALAKALGVPPLVAALLVNRGIEGEDAARRYLNPSLADLSDPFALPDCDKAVERLARAIADGERIFVHGDYDADGVTSAAICVRALAGLGADVVGFVPKRSDGYDFQPYGAEKAKEAGASVILTADCGVTAVAATERANALGLDVVITDHHRPGKTLPPAVAVVDPYREDVPAPPFQPLCGAGVAFKVLDALVSVIQPQHRAAFQRNFVDLAALGTVADVTPLVGENRVIVAHGLKALENPKKAGIEALLLSMDLKGKPLEADNLAMRLGPRLNAAGRIFDPDIAFRLLTTKDPDEAESLAVQMGALHERVREETARATAEALADALSPEHEGQRVLVLARPAWGFGIVGIVAARVVEATRKPVLLLAYDEEHDSYHGSGRSWGSFNLLEALHGASDLLGRYGGHHAAAGVSVPAANLEALRERLHQGADGILDEEPEPPTLEIDLEVGSGTVVNLDLLDWLGKLAPFGRDNPEPTFLTRGAVLLSARRVGKDGNTASFVFKLPGAEASFKAVKFQSGDLADAFTAGTDVDLVYTPKANHWNGRTSVDLMLKDLRVAE